MSSTLETISSVSLNRFLVIEKIEEVLRKNSTLIYIDMDGNGIYNTAASKFITLMKEGNPLLLIEFGVLANKEVMDDFKKLLKKRKKKERRRKRKGRRKRSDRMVY